MRVWTSRRYAVEAAGHPLRTSKFHLAGELAAERLGAALAEPAPASPEELAWAHSSAWTAKVLEGRLSEAESARAELAWSPELALAHRLHYKGTLEACRDALKTGLGLHAGGGSHHAFRDAGAGYCLFNDLAGGVLWALGSGAARAAVVDLDAHQGDGTASILASEPRAFAFSIHQEDLYPERKTPGRLDVGLRAGAGDRAYLDALAGALREVLDGFRPELVLVQAGVDPYEWDLKGGLGLTEAGLEARDRLVFEACARRGLPCAVTLGGGYPRDPEAAVRLHARTLVLAAELLSGARR